MATQETPPVRLHRRLGWTLAGLLLVLLLLLVSAGGGLWWSVRTEAGAAWLLSRLPGLQISGGKGTLWGDYSAERLEFALPRGGKVVLSGLVWRGSSIERAPWVDYGARVVMSELSADRVDVVPPAGDKEAPAPPPRHLRLPVELEVDRLHIGELHTAALGEKPLRALRAGVHLGAEFGKAHRITDFEASWDRLKAGGSAQIGTADPLPMQVEMALAQSGDTDTAAWRAQAALRGPLAQPLLRATVRAQPVQERPEQSFDLTAALRPFEAWPLGELQARTTALDLSAFHSAAPVTSLSGEARARSSGTDQPATVDARFRNDDAGRWNEGRLPLRDIALQLRARPDDPRTLDVQGMQAQLGTKWQSAGSVQASGRWTPQEWTVDASLDALQPSLLDDRAPAMVLSGPVAIAGSGFGEAPAAPKLAVKAQLAGRFAARGPARDAHLRLAADATANRIDVQELEARAGAARASASGVMTREREDAPWRVAGQAALVDFDPAPWWPGRENSAWRKGPHRLNAKADFDMLLPGADRGATVLDRLAALRGRATAKVTNSLLAGVPIAGEARLRSGAGATSTAALTLDAAGNRLSADGRIGAGDRWDLVLNAPALERVAPLWQLGAAGDGTLAGALSGRVQVAGRWPAVTTQGQVDASGLRIGRTSTKQVQARWQLGSGPDGTVDAQATLSELQFTAEPPNGLPPIVSAQGQLKGTMRSHSLELRAETRARPPAWTDTFQRPPGASAVVGPPAQTGTVALLQARGGAFQAERDAWAGWRGQVQRLELVSAVPAATPWIRTGEVGIALQWADGPARVEVQPGRAEVLGAALRWSRIAWQGAFGGRPAQLDAQAELEPLPVAPLLARAQPAFGWGGDLAVVGHLNVRSAPGFTADIVIERQRGDLTVTDETGNTQALGLTDLRLGLDVQDGVWSFTQGLAGNTLGVAAGAVVARTSPQATWPSPDTPIQGVLEVQVANLGTWGPWVPAGWRLTGALRTSAGIGGRFGAPEYTGEMRGSGLGMRNFLQGVNVTDGDVAIALQGATARIERFTARGGSGSVRLEGNATLGSAPKALLQLQADKFQLLGRVDRRIVTSGQAQLQLDSETLALDGRFGIDEGLFDFTRSDAPRLPDDVTVIRGRQADSPAPASHPLPDRAVRLDLRVDLGEQLRIRGRGLDAGLRGELHITSPGNRMAVNGTVRAVDGTYDAYGQKLVIERGLLAFSGAAENPRLDIEATRPNADVRVGVLVSGTALNPRVRLFSDPEMSELDKLSWLVLGRASEGLGRTDTALLQRAALALLAGEGDGVTDQFTRAIGLDEVSLRQTEGEVRETVISLGKQLSRRWYVGYERSLNATAGTWQLIYRIARRFTLRAQSGEDNSLDVIWTWRWE